MRNVEVVAKVETRLVVQHIDIKLNAEDWQLYSDMSGAALCAYRLNQSLMSVIKKGFDRAAVEKYMDTIMVKNSNWGADDTEPHYVLNKILDKVYGKTNA